MDSHKTEKKKKTPDPAQIQFHKLVTVVYLVKFGISIILMLYFDIFTAQPVNITFLGAAAKLSNFFFVLFVKF